MIGGAIGCLVVVYLICVWIAMRESGSWSTPLMLLLLWMGLFGVVDAVYTGCVGEIGINESRKYKSNAVHLSMTIGIWAMAIASLTAGYVLSRGSRVHQKYVESRRTPPDEDGIETGEETQPVATRSICAVLTIALLISVGCMGFFARRGASIGIDVYRIAADRNSVIADGAAPILALLQAHKVALVLAFAYFWGNGLRASTYLYLNAAIAIAFDSVLGQRSATTFLLFFPLLFLYDRLCNRIPLSRLATIGLTLLIVLTIYRSATRDIHFRLNQGKSGEEVIADNLANFLPIVLGGYDVSAFDGSADVTNHYIYGKQPLLMGSTFLQGAVAFVPRSFWPSKPTGGASTVYTETIQVGFFSGQKTELTVSFIGELIMNFGVYGIVPAFLLIGFIVGTIGRNMQHHLESNSASIAAFSLFFPKFYNLFKGDTYSFVAQTTILLLAWIVVYAVAKAMRIDFRIDR